MALPQKVRLGEILVQQKLLTTASEECWNVEKIEAEIARIRRANGDGRGRT